MRIHTLTHTLSALSQYKANQYEQELELSSTPLSPLSPLLPNQTSLTAGSFSDSPGSPPPHWDTMSSVSTATPPGWTPTSSVGGMSSWGSFSSVSTIDGKCQKSAIWPCLWFVLIVGQARSFNIQDFVLGCDLTFPPLRHLYHYI